MNQTNDQDLVCEHDDCDSTTKVRDYYRTEFDIEPDAEGPLSDAEKKEWMNEPIALCPRHAGNRRPFKP